MKTINRRTTRRTLSAALLLSAGAFAAPAMALECAYIPMDTYQCSTTYTPLPDDILFWSDGVGNKQDGGAPFTAPCASYGMLNVSLVRWNGRRFEVVSGARGMCLSGF